jgi:hypothetical protein
MEVTRTLRKVGGSVMLAIPPEILEEGGLAEGANVVVRSRPGGGFQVEPEGLDAEFVAWVHRNLERYDAAYRQLADR